jgi:hypothetical protein
MVCDMETSEMLPHGTSATPKTNLSFILNPTLGNTSTLPHLYDIMKKVVKLEEMEEEEEEEGEEMEEYLVSPKQTIEYIMSSSEDLARLEQLDPRMDPNARVLGRKRPRRTNTCKEEGCNSAVVSRGRCVRHGVCCI